MEAQKLLYRLLIYIDPVTQDGQRIRERSDSIAITSSTNATPIVVTTSSVHSLKSGDKVFIFGHVTNTNANNTLANPAWPIIVLGTTTFSLTGSSGNGVGSAGTCVPAYVGSVAGDKFPRAQEHVDILNRARWALMGFVVNAFRKNKDLDVETMLPGWVLNKTNLEFAAGSANKPTGYVETLKLKTVGGLRIPVLTVSEYERAYNGGHLSVTNPAVQDISTTLLDESLGTNVPNATTYVLKYLALVDFTITDILQLSGYTNGTETLDDERIELLLRAGVAIARGAGAEELNVIFAKEFGL